ncbi:MAG: ABC transporter substrate-binding protein [Pseudomonadota bacterium]
MRQITEMARDSGRIFATAIMTAALFCGATTSAVAEQKDLRILSVGSDVTEIVYALGFGDRVVAVDTTSQHPPEALANNKSVGYMRALSAEGVLSIGANLLLVSEGAGPAETIRALKSSSARYVAIPDGKSADGLAEKIDLIGQTLGVEDQADALKSAVLANLKALKKRSQSVERRKRVLFVLNASAGRLIVGGRNTSADQYVQLAGAENAASSIDGFKPVTAEGIVTMKPDAILVMRGGRNGQTASELLTTAAVALTPAGKAGKASDISGVYALGFGPRLPSAATDLHNWLYNNRDKPE